MPSLVSALVSALVFAAASTPAPELRTVAEDSGFVRTGRYDEVLRLCPAFEHAYPGRARCFEMGRTPEGRPMLALVASQAGLLEPAAARASGRPIVLVQGGIHAGEIDGKDGGFLALRELLDLGSAGPLARVVLLFVPVFNVDGHERFGPNNRPNQRGPAEMGWRTTAQNLNLNRDYLKAETPEMQAMLRLLATWDPVAYVDLHVTDGAKFQPDLSFMIEPLLAGDPGLRRVGRALRDELIARLDREGHHGLPFYPTFVRDDDPASGFSAEVAPPRSSESYTALRNRLGILVEAHSWKDYGDRVHAAHDTVRVLLDLAARDGAAWVAAARAADEASAKLGGSDFPLAFRAGEHTVRLHFPGYAYRLEPSPISGRAVVRYDESKPEVWEIPFYDEVKPSVTVRLPQGGWIVPPEHAGWLGDKLALHGVAFTKLGDPRPHVAAETLRATAIRFAPTSFEGRQHLSIDGQWAPATRDVLAGSLFVPVAQPRARVAAHLLEPSGPASLLVWGFFDAAFEKKEYMEAYVLEDVARRMLDLDPALRAEFARRLDDPAFAGDPAARMEMFQRRHPSWDDRFGLYPVYRVATAP